jgi:hypothetical protein
VGTTCRSQRSVPCKTTSMRALALLGCTGNRSTRTARVPLCPSLQTCRFAHAEVFTAPFSCRYPFPKQHIVELDFSAVADFLRSTYNLLMSVPSHADGAGNLLCNQRHNQPPPDISGCNKCGTLFGNAATLPHTGPLQAARFCRHAGSHSSLADSSRRPRSSGSWDSSKEAFRIESVRSSRCGNVVLPITASGMAKNFGRGASISIKIQSGCG